MAVGFRVFSFFVNLCASNGWVSQASPLLAMKKHGYGRVGIHIILVFRFLVRYAFLMGIHVIGK